MARISNNILPGDAQLALTLDRYQEILHLPIAAFNGLNNPDEEPVYECSTIWKQSERDQLAIHLMRAEEMREQELVYHLAPKYRTDERHMFAQPIILDRKFFIAGGVRATTDIATPSLTLSIGGVPIDPVVISVATTVTNTDEIGVFYPGEDVRITPSNISISGGTATIRIPRSRLVDPSLLDNREDHLQYDDDANFLTTVDVKRVYTDPSDSASFVWTAEQLACIGNLTYPDGSEQTQTGLITPVGERAYRLSTVKAFPAAYASGAWTGAEWRYCAHPGRIDINYKSGIVSSMSTEVLTIKLAHTLMPNIPCSCPYIEQYWKEDHNKHPDGLNTPYGGSVGAVEAWMADARAKIGQGGMFR